MFRNGEFVTQPDDGPVIEWKPTFWLAQVEGVADFLFIQAMPGAPQMYYAGFLSVRSGQQVIQGRYPTLEAAKADAQRLVETLMRSRRTP